MLNDMLMMQNRRVKIIAGISGLLLLSLVTPVPAASDNGSEATADNAGVMPIQQKPGDLLAGFKRAVCYSGFRHGQHPDRGQGAVNPSDKEILQDLQILSRQGNFGLIRLYDSQANSEAVLRLIETNKLNLKVLLGAWLDAEVSNPSCPWHHEPLPGKCWRRTSSRMRRKSRTQSVWRISIQIPSWPWP